MDRDLTVSIPAILDFLVSKKELFVLFLKLKNMPYRIEDWLELVLGLENAQDLLLQAKEKPEKKALFMSLAVLSLWSFGEYAINVVLEIHGDKPEQNHRHADRAAALALDGSLQTDYSLRLAQLEKYRLKAVHKGYSRGRSVHYSSQDVRNCLKDMLELQSEVEALLRSRGKLA